MYTCKFASQDLYTQLSAEYGDKTFNGGKSFDEFFAERFDFEVTDPDVNPGWGDDSLAEDDSAVDHAFEYTADNVD